MYFLGNYFGAEPAYGPETQEQYEKRMREESYGPGLPPDVKDSAYEKKWKEQEEKQAAQEAVERERYGRAAGRGVTTALDIRGQVQAGRPVLTSGGRSPRVTAGGGTYGPGYAEPGTAPQQQQNGFISRNKWLLIGAGGGGIAILLLTTVLLLKKKKEF